MRSRACRLLGVGAACICWTSLLATASAATGDKKGWSVDTDARHRAFLKYVPADNGPRLLVIGCLRDIDSFTVLAQHASDGGPSDASTTLTLASGAAQYSVRGRFDANATGLGERGFASEFDLDAKGRRALQRRLLPVLQARGAIRLGIGAWSQDLPATGLGAVIGRFKAVCFD